MLRSARPELVPPPTTPTAAPSASHACRAMRGFQMHLVRALRDFFLRTPAPALPIAGCLGECSAAAGPYGSDVVLQPATSCFFCPVFLFSVVLCLIFLPCFPQRVFRMTSPCGCAQILASKISLFFFEYKKNSTWDSILNA